MIPSQVPAPLADTSYMINADTLQTLALHDTVAVKIGTNARATRYTVTFVCDNFVGLQGPRGGSKSLVPSTCGGAVQLTSLHGRDWVSELVKGS